jgi:hypothetical protein
VRHDNRERRLRRDGGNAGHRRGDCINK